MKKSYSASAKKKSSSQGLLCVVVKVKSSIASLRPVIRQDGQSSPSGQSFITLSLEQSHGLWLGDHVCVNIHEQSYQVVSHEGHHRTHFYGIVESVLSKGHYRLQIDEKNSDLYCETTFPKKLKLGTIVLITILKYPQKKKLAQAKIIRVIDEEDPYEEERLLCQQYDIPLSFPKTLQLDEKAIRQTRDEYEHERVDLTHLPFVTIDGDDAKDFDDAVYATVDDRVLKLFVAIADVSAYVKPETLLDQEARRRSNSVYLPGLTIPMLPEILSNDLCSLCPQLKRQVLVCEMDIGKRGAIKKYSFYLATIRSHKRLTYDKALKILQKNNTKETCYSALQSLFEVYQVLLKAKKRRGALDFDLPEYRIKTQPKEPKNFKITVAYRHDIHRLIEECMLAANICAADFLTTKAQYFPIYRVHPEPQESRIEQLKAVLAERFISLQKGFGKSIKEYSDLIEHLAEVSDDTHPYQMLVLRSMKPACYSLKNIGHFGLNYPLYTHFTSPIRRYVDLLVHRMIKAVLYNSANPVAAYSRQSMSNWLDIFSETERQSEEASRSMVAFYKCLYMKRYIGRTYHAKIMAVAEFGLFLSVGDIGVEGVLYISRLGNDYFYFDPKRMMLCGRRSGHVYRLGDLVSVKVDNVLVRQRRVLLSLA